MRAMAECHTIGLLVETIILMTRRTMPQRKPCVKPLLVLNSRKAAFHAAQFVSQVIQSRLQPIAAAGIVLSSQLRRPECFVFPQIIPALPELRLGCFVIDAIRARP